MDLREYLISENSNVSEFAKKIEYCRPYVIEIVMGIRKPGKKMIRKIIEATRGKVTERELLNMQRIEREKSIFS